MTKTKMSPQEIADAILEIARENEDEAQDLVAAIHGVLMDIGLILGEHMARIRAAQ